MNSNDIYALLIKIGRTPGKNDKTALVAQHGTDPLFRQVLCAAINPLVTYGVKQVPSPVEVTDGCEFDAATWLLIEALAVRQLTGHAARDAIAAEFARLTLPSQCLLRRILLKKLDAGFDASTTNKAIKGLIPEFPYMRCSLPKNMKLSEKDFGWSEGAISQEKADGMFMNLDHEVCGLVRLTSRQGNEFPMDALEAFAQAVRVTIKPGTQSHGEMVVVRNGVVLEREIGNGILNHIQDGGHFAQGDQPLFLLWDQIPLSAVVPKGKYTVPYKARLTDLIAQLRGSVSAFLKLIPTKIVRSLEEAWEHYREMLKLGKEGTVFKKARAIWRDGTSTEQGKLKLKAPFEVKVVGFNEGTGKFVGMLGSLICESSCGELAVNVSGRGDKMRAEVWANRPDWLGVIITAEGNLVMEPKKPGDKHSIFLPIFVERRRDKTQADDLVQIKAQFEAAIAAA